MSQPPNNSDNVAIEDKALDTESVIDLLGEGDDKEPETLELEKPVSGDSKAESEEKKAPTETEEEELSLEEKLELELNEEHVDEDTLELVDLPSRKEILAA